MENGSYFFYSIDNLIKEFQVAQGLVLPMLTLPEQVEAMARENGVVAFSEHLHPFTATELAHGCIVPVMKPITFTPVERMEQFHIVCHAHEYKGLIYEVGHSHGILQTFSGFGTAEETFGELARRLPARTSRISYDLILVGQFRDQTLRLNSEGYPEYNTGLPLKTAFYEEGSLKINLIMDPFKQMTINQRFFAGYNSDKEQLVYFDDRLQEIVPGASVQSFIESNFRSNLGILLLSATVPKLKIDGEVTSEMKTVQHEAVASFKRILKIKGAFPVGSRDRKGRRRR